ncbi:MAG: DUF6398 domain-containing protein [Phycisphaeraceae bacterium]
MTTTDHAFESLCREHLDRFFLVYPDPVLQQRSMKALRMLRASDKPLTGKTEGWAAGIIYAVANDGCSPCGVPGVLNSEFERFMGVTMSTVRERAARVREVIIF